MALTYSRTEMNGEQIKKFIFFLDRELKQKGKWNVNNEMDCEVLYFEAYEYAKENRQPELADGIITP